MPALLSVPLLEHAAGGPGENTGTRQPPEEFKPEFVHEGGVNMELQLAFAGLGVPPFEHVAGVNTA